MSEPTLPPGDDKPTPAAAAPQSPAATPVATPADAVQTADQPAKVPITVNEATSAEAAFQAMINKIRRTDEHTFNLPQPDGSVVTITCKLEALTGPEYDALQAKYPPKPERAAKGDTYDPEKFNPALLAAVVKTPNLTLAQWKQICGAENWSGGEITTLVAACVRVCMVGLDVPFSSGG